MASGLGPHERLSTLVAKQPDLYDVYRQLEYFIPYPFSHTICCAALFMGWEHQLLIFKRWKQIQESLQDEDVSKVRTRKNSKC